MTLASTNLVRTLVIYTIVLPLALFLGYLLATPLDYSSLFIVGIILGVLCIPFALKWHYPAMFLTWNMTAMAFFLPGRPFLWLFFAFLSFGISVIQRTLMRDMRFIYAPSVVLPVLFLAGVILITGELTGGFGLRAFGSAQVGGKAYYVLFGGVAGFLAMLARRIPAHKAQLYLRLFFLGAVTDGIGYSINFIAPGFLWYLFLIFPVESLPGHEGSGIARYGGLSIAALSVFWYLLARYGITELLREKRFWRLFLLFAVFVVAIGGGFRTYFIFTTITLFFVCYFEGFFRTKFAVPAVALVLMAFAALVPIADELPLPIQRAISFLPLHIDPNARTEGEKSSEWRIEMWKRIIPDIPRYFWLGKGLETSDMELQFANDITDRSGGDPYAGMILAGNFHNGPLTVIIFFGIWGAIGWLWFLAASIRALYLNHRYGDAYLQRVNTLLLSLFIGKTLLFFVVYGDFRVEFPFFAGVVGLGLALNGGIRKPVLVRAKTKPIAIRYRPEPTFSPALPKLGAHRLPNHR